MSAGVKPSSARVASLVDVRALAAEARQTGLDHGLTPAQAEHLALVVAELGSNAVVHGRGGSVSLRVSRAGWLVEVVDRGPGFSEAVLADGGRSDALGLHGVRPRDQVGRTFGAGLASVRRLSTRLSLKNLNPGASVEAEAELTPFR
ncbi:MAG: ATP-binding protein [Myxococcaceae bacterium]|nr:ATP-binding protein [Myxococcaceae bacterium]